MPATPRVSPKRRSPTHDLELIIGGRYHVGLLVDPADIRDTPQTPSTLRLTAAGGAGNKYGDFDPTMAYVEQRSWVGGMGQESFSEDPERFLDSRQCFTLVENKLLPGGLVVSGQRSGIRSAQAFMPGADSTGIQFKFVSLLGSNRYYAYVFQISATYNADKAHLIIRRVGSPGTLTVELRNANGGNNAPGTTVNKTVTKTTSDIADTLADEVVFDWTSTQSLTATNYASIVVYGASTDTVDNHWEILVSPDVSDSNTSSDGSSWSGQTANRMYYGVLDAEIGREFFFFELDGMPYAVTKNDDGSASKLYMNGVRGKATSATSTTISDTNQTLNVLGLNAIVRIINGTGAGQARVVSSATTNQITVSVAWDITPDTTSEYVAIGTKWAEVSSTGLGAVTGKPAVTGSLPGVAYFPQGATTIRRMRFDATASPPAHGFADDATDDADLLFPMFNPQANQMEVWRARSAANKSEVARAAAQTWGTNLTFTNADSIGNTRFPITGLNEFQYGGDTSSLTIFKEDGIWKRQGENAYTRLPVGLESVPNPTNGKVSIVHNQFLYFNYLHRWQRLLGKTVDDLGPRWPTGIGTRTGIISSVVSAFGWLFVAVDAGTSGRSSVLCWTGRSWHEIYRAPFDGARIRGLYWWHAHGVRRPMLYIGVGTVIDAVYFPLNSLNPLDDTLFPYNYQSSIITSTFDYGNVHIPKFAKELSSAIKNLAAGIYAVVDYQTDDNIGGTTWTRLGSFFSSPEDVLYLGLGNIRQIRFRITSYTETYYTPVEIRAYGLEGYARTPVKYLWTIRAREQPVQLNRRGGRDLKPDDLFAVLKEAANGAMRVRVRAAPWLKRMDGLDVIVEPPTLSTEAGDNEKKSWAGVLNIVLREV